MREHQEETVDDIMASIGITQVDGAASLAHYDMAYKLLDAVLAKHNRYKLEENPNRVARGEEPYKLDEVKQFTMCRHKGMSSTYVLIETGLVGDEGTAASFYCRDYRHIAISKRGGLTLLNPKRKRESLGFFNCVHSLTK